MVKKSFIRCSAISLAVMISTGCYSQVTPAIDTIFQNNEFIALDRGEVIVKPMPIRQVSQKKIVNFGDLIETKNIWDFLKDSRQSNLTSSSAHAFSAALEFFSESASLEQRSLKIKPGTFPGLTRKGDKARKNQAAEDAEDANAENVGTESEEIEGAENETTDNGSKFSSAADPFTFQLNRAELANLSDLLNKYQNMSNGSSPSLSLHELMYATANGVLAGNSLEHIYDFENIPYNTDVYIMPVVVNFHPGRVTRSNYMISSELSLTMPDAQKLGKSAIKDIRIIAAAPGGFSNFMTKSEELLEQIKLEILRTAKNSEQVNSNIASDYASRQANKNSDNNIQANFQNLIENYKKFESIIKQPEFTVSIKDNHKVNVKYFGTKDYKNNTALNDASFVVELILLIEKNEITKCIEIVSNNEIHQQQQQQQIQQSQTKFYSKPTDNILVNFTYEYIFQPIYGFNALPFGYPEKYSGSPNASSSSGFQIPLYLQRNAIEIKEAIFNKKTKKIVMTGTNFLDETESNIVKKLFKFTVHSPNSQGGKAQQQSYLLSSNPQSKNLAPNKTNSTSLSEIELFKQNESSVKTNINIRAASNTKIILDIPENLVDAIGDNEFLLEAEIYERDTCNDKLNSTPYRFVDYKFFTLNKQEPPKETPKPLPQIQVTDIKSVISDKTVILTANIESQVEPDGLLFYLNNQKVGSVQRFKSEEIKDPKDESKIQSYKTKIILSHSLSKKSDNLKKVLMNISHTPEIKGKKQAEQVLWSEFISID